ncbi:uncharacterized protein LOC128622307 isoform X6 [Ictalurus furcatus]|uniref:uncharacterized protein LOC128622307 isoform X6 n=1 Tax=Ictalurus furcatus TaxID=66913 RepID=UPI00235057EF|nr:uncharacterized protein LOC128622307 isoform X6 [Ictalurus furcatus]
MYTNVLFYLQQMQIKAITHNMMKVNQMTIEPNTVKPLYPNRVIQLTPEKSVDLYFWEVMTLQRMRHARSYSGMGRANKELIWKGGR